MDVEEYLDNFREHLHKKETNPLRIFNRRFNSKRLHTEIAGIKLDNPLIVGAGYDKAGRCVRALYMAGFAGVEVGSVLANYQKGNDKPRHALIGKRASINRYGFNSPGMDFVSQNLNRYKKDRIPIGINIGMNKTNSFDDAPRAYAEVAEKFLDQASYLSLGVSSANTPGLRQLQNRGPLAEIVSAVVKKVEKRVPIFIKIDPDMSLRAVDDVVAVALDYKIAGVIVANSSINSGLKVKYGENWRNEEGGFSGDDPEFRNMSNNILYHIYSHAGNSLELFGVGGIYSSKDVLDKILSGAKAVQIVTALITEGPRIANRINHYLDAAVKKLGVKSISELGGQRSI